MSLSIRLTKNTRIKVGHTKNDMVWQHLLMYVCAAINPWKQDYISFSSCIMTAKPGNRNNRYCSSVREFVCAWLEADNSRVVQIGTIMTSVDHTKCYKKQFFPSDTKMRKKRIRMFYKTKKKTL